MKQKLEILRNKIDQEDQKLLKSLSKRFKIVEKIGMLKTQNEIAPKQNNRWNSLLKDRMATAKELGLNQIMVKEIFKLIHIVSLKNQSKLSKRKSK